MGWVFHPEVRIQDPATECVGYVVIEMGDVADVADVADAAAVDGEAIAMDLVEVRSGLDWGDVGSWVIAGDVETVRGVGRVELPTSAAEELVTEIRMAAVGDREGLRHGMRTDFVAYAERQPRASAVEREKAGRHVETERRSAGR